MVAWLVSHSHLLAGNVPAPAERSVEVLTATITSEVAQSAVKQAAEEVSQDAKPAEVVSPPVAAPIVLDVSEAKETIIDDVQENSASEESAEPSGTWGSTDLIEDVTEKVLEGVHEAKASTALEHDEQLPAVPEQVTSSPVSQITAVVEHAEAPQAPETEAQPSHNESEGASSEVPPTHEEAVADVKEAKVEQGSTEETNGQADSNAVGKDISLS